jgi:hypothetical protein
MPPKTTRIDVGPSSRAFAVTKSDVTVLAGVRSLYVGGAGDLTVEMLNPETPGVTVVFTAVPAGTVLPISVERVLAATTATNIVALC